jgi:hypothetical protein
MGRRDNFVPRLGRTMMTAGDFLAALYPAWPLLTVTAREVVTDGVEGLRLSCAGPMTARQGTERSVGPTRRSEAEGGGGSC